MNVLVTGGSGDIGGAIVDLFKKNGHQVYSPNRDEIDLRGPIKLKNCEFDVVINCAGVNPIVSLLDIVNNEVMKVNYESPLEIVQQCLPYMINNRYGKILNIGSIWINTAKKGRLQYAASKNALHALTKSIVAEYSHHNIIANTLSPGFVKTKLTYKNNSKDDILKIINEVPLKRLGNTEEIAKMAYVLTIENNYINGQNIIIDGGFSCVAL